MSTKEDIKEEEINTTEETQQVEENQEVASENLVDEPTSEELIQAEKDKFLRLLPSLKITKKEQPKSE